MPRILFVLQSLFSLWMLVDAVGRRGLSRYWYFVILMPFGEVFYFFKIKIHDPEFAWLKAPFGRLLVKPVTIEELRFNMEQTPSLANKIALAQALHDEDHFREAADLFEKTLRTADDSSECLYGLGLSRIGLGEHERAIEPLLALVKNDPKYQDYDGWHKLALALWKVDRRQETCEKLSDLVLRSPRIQHRMLYAYYLAQEQRLGEAQEQLTTALREYEYAPRYLKRRNKVLFKQAKGMLQRLSES